MNLIDDLHEENAKQAKELQELKKKYAELECIHHLIILYYKLFMGMKNKIK